MKKFERLQDRFEEVEGYLPLSGIQAIVRSIVDSHRRLNQVAPHGTYISGYQGSPLGGVDVEIERSKITKNHENLIFHPALNEELAATSMGGSQLLDAISDDHRVRGITAFWYGKSPGVDRAGDAIRHGNIIGTSPHGGVVLLAGDDPAAKSSTVPGSSDATLAAMGLPVAFPGNSQDLLDLMMHNITMSQLSGLWVANKVVTKVADSSGTYRPLDNFDPVIPQLTYKGLPFVHSPSAHLLGANLMHLEETMMTIRLDVAKEYIYQNRLNSLYREARSTERIGIVAVGTAYHDCITALELLGYRDHDSIRLMKLLYTNPLDHRVIEEFANGLEMIIVIEEKQSFVERSIKEILFAHATRPIVIGKTDREGTPLFVPFGAFEADNIATNLYSVLNPIIGGDRAQQYIEAQRSRTNEKIVLLEQRTPFFCSGCPHNSSTRVEDGSVVGAGIGCHTLVLLNPNSRGKVAGVTQMGGEGAQFFSVSPFIEKPHFIQNMGDGTFHHSGSLAIRAAVAAGANITYKILYNDAVAMTGGQKVEGQLTIPEMVSWLYLEGVSRVEILTEDLSRYRNLQVDSRANISDRTRLQEVQHQLSKVSGVTAIIFDQTCAIEKRRRRRAGTMEQAHESITINERICEGCGDCGEKSNCLSVEPVMTQLGRKTRINQGSCSHDTTCTKGDCPSFLVTKGQLPTKARQEIKRRDLPLPQITQVADCGYNMRLVGIGGTGVVTLAAIVEVATLLDGKYSRGMDQTGLSQKAGPVISDISISTMAIQGSAPLPNQSADLLLGFDLLGSASEKNIAVLTSRRSKAVISAEIVPTGREVTEVTHVRSSLTAALDLVQKHTVANGVHTVDAHKIALWRYGDVIAANVIVLGTAWQLGLIPLTLESIDRAFELNKANLEENREAFYLGRLAVVAPDEIEKLMSGESDRYVAKKEYRDLVASRLPRLESNDSEDISFYYEDLIGFQSLKVADAYLAKVVEFANAPDIDLSSEMIRSYARLYHKLIAVKDEYEVARLHRIWKDQHPEVKGASMLLHPPILRAMGLKNKIKLGKSATPTMWLLTKMKPLRGTSIDIFGKTKMRKIERELPAKFVELVALVLRTSRSTDDLYTIFESVDMIRGYEQIRMVGIERFGDLSTALSQRLNSIEGSRTARR
ncbi:MAG: indolepyruvate ferredoxin oxidoreductase family protein [Actinomycetota bacterium]|nr:indolepyruvate ferredoxin oxidoreductase family protein [Actinomycetota bacterium]